MHDAFIQAIQEAGTPEEICLAQGIYADWLEEQGDERCEFLRRVVFLSKQGDLAVGRYRSPEYHLLRSFVVKWNKRDLDYDWLYGVACPRLQSLTKDGGAYHHSMGIIEVFPRSRDPFEIECPSRKGFTIEEGVCL